MNAAITIRHQLLEPSMELLDCHHRASFTNVRLTNINEQLVLSKGRQRVVSPSFHLGTHISFSDGSIVRALAKLSGTSRTSACL